MPELGKRRFFESCGMVRETYLRTIQILPGGCHRDQAAANKLERGLDLILEIVILLALEDSAKQTKVSHTPRLQEQVLI
jgi:hypothetical protein